MCIRDRYLTVAHERQPHLLTECFGVSYDEFTEPRNVALVGDELPVAGADRQVSTWMELLTPTTANVFARYGHPFWGRYAAVTENAYGKGSAAYVGCMPTKAYLKAFLRRRLARAGLWGTEQKAEFPVIVKSGVNGLGKTVRFYFNYSMEPRKQEYFHGHGVEPVSYTHLACAAAHQRASSSHAPGLRFR